MIQIITDTCSDLNFDEAKKLGITVIPMTIQFGNKQYSDRVDLSVEEFYKKLAKSKDLPTTSQITPYTFEQYYKKFTDAGDDVLVITMSSRLSGTYQSAVIAAEDYDNVYVIDTLCVSVGEQCIVKYAATLRDKGLDIATVAKEAGESVEHLHILALLDTLEYLKKGGRISPAIAFAGSVLSIKPAVTVIDGEVQIAGKARGSKHGNNLLMQLIEKTGGIDFDKPLLLGYTGNDSSLLDQYIEDSRRIWEGKTDALSVSHIGSTVGTHVGPGAIAVAFFS